MTNSLIQQFLIIFVISFFIYYIWKRRQYYILTWKLNSYSLIGLPFIGLAFNIRKQEDILQYIENSLEKLPRNQYTLGHGIVWFGPYPFYYVLEPELIQKILTSTNCINRMQFYDIFTKHFGLGIISSNNPVWSYHRKRLNPAFNLKILKSFQSIFNQEIHKLCTKLQQFVVNSGGNCNGGKGIDIMPLIQLCALDITCQTTMGKSMNFQQNQNGEIVQSYYNLSKVTMMRVFQPFYHWDFIFSFTKLSEICTKSQKILRQFVTQLIEDKLENQPNNNSTSKNFIDLTIELLKSKEFTWQEAVDESNDIVFAGYETSANTLSYTLMCLAMFPEYQEKLFQELVEQFPDKNNFQINYDDLQNLKYCEMVINENLRLIAPVPMVGRSTIQDFEISPGIILPKNTQIVIDIFNMQRDPTIWGPNAKTFYPDHFSPENLQKLHSYAFIPFTKGLRTCIGSRYSMLSVKTMLATLIRKFQFTTEFQFKDLHFIDNIVIKLKNVPLLKIHERLY